MKRREAIKAAACIAAVSALGVPSTYAFAEETIAVLDLRFIEDTGDTAGVLCFGEDETDCAQWSTYYLFEATPRRVISGELPEEPFLVLFGRHALKKRNLKNVAARLEERDDVESGEARYRITEWGRRLSMYCFARREGDEAGLAVELNDKRQLTCFDTERY